MQGRHRIVLPFLAAAILLCGGIPASGQKRTPVKDSTDARGPRNYRSRNFLVHTDLPERQAKQLVGRLERMLGLISKYWRRRNQRTIEIYVVDDLNNWPAEALDPRGYESIRAGGGVTLSTTISRGNAFVATATSYAVAERGTPLHEAVHAYCAQSFGTTGPVWYSEGMAEMGAYWDQKNPAVNCGPHIVRYIRESKPKSLNEIINSPETTGDSWQNYAWRWALCHMLANNENYRDRFRPLGMALLSKKNTSFEQVYGAMAREISFEYLFFLEHLEVGFRTDLCSWDWKTRYLPPRSSRSLVSKIEANRGWQPSRMRAQKGETYEVSTSGTWKTSEEGPAVSAAGDKEGNGRLVGILFDDYELGEPFDLGEEGTFTAPGDGDLLLRCRDEWHQLSDNSGRITVRLKRAAAAAHPPNSKEPGEPDR